MINFQFVDTSKIDVAPDILPVAKADWENISHYPLKAVDQAFLTEATIDRFIEIDGILPGAMSSYKYPDPEKPFDDQPTNTLAWNLMWHVRDCINTRANGTIYIQQKTYEDKSGYEEPDYSDFLAGIQTEGDGDSLVRHKPLVYADFRDLYKDIRKFKRKTVPQGHRTTHIDDLGINHTNTSFPITDWTDPDYSIGSTETAFFAWKRKALGGDDPTNDRYDVKYRNRGGLGYYIECRNVLNKDKLKEIHVLFEYEIHRFYTVKNLGVTYAVDEPAYKCEWIDMGSLKEQGDKLAITIPEIYYSYNTCKSVVNEFFPDWGDPVRHYFEDGSYSDLTAVTVNPFPKIVCGELNLHTEF